jgi:hypothetical protein
VFSAFHPMRLKRLHRRWFQSMVRVNPSKVDLGSCYTILNATAGKRLRLRATTASRHSVWRQSK